MAYSRFQTTIRGRCSRCCPDGGACFDRWGDEAKRCRNCGLVVPFRKVQATGKSTPSQQRILDRIVTTFGGEPEIQMIGRKLFVSLHNPARNWMLGDSLFGTIGVGGHFEITLQRVGGDVKITDDIGIKVYLS